MGMSATFNLRDGQRFWGDKIFLLDAREVRNESYGYSDEQWGGDNRKKFCIQRQENWSWWLRSEEEHPTLPENDGMCAGAISRRVVICFFVNEYCGVSPVLNVRLSDVLMVSIVEGTAGQTGAAYKLTLINPAMEIRPEQSTSAQSEEQVTVPYRLTGADIDNATWVSVLFTKKDTLQRTVIMMPGKQFIFRMRVRTVKQYFRFQRNTGTRNAEPIIMFI